MNEHIRSLSEVSLDERDGDLWVFGYGSLMWRPGFEFLDFVTARISGWRRRLCIHSHIYRGTVERPGLVLGLDEGGECEGVAYRVAATKRARTIEYLRERELATSVYKEKMLSARLALGEEVLALTYVADVGHEQYAHEIHDAKLLAIIRDSVGVAGSNAEYVINTYEHLCSLGIRDAELEFLARQLRSG